jgi:ligand-binding sensor domain-containing protein
MLFWLNKRALRTFFIITAIIFTCNTCSITMAQELFTWKIYTNKQAVRDACMADGVIWEATDGGVVAYNVKDSSFQTYTKAEGLAGSIFTAIARDNKGRIWVGSEGGIIDVIKPSDNTVHSIYDVYLTNYVNKSINDLLVSGDSVFVSTDFGMTVIQSSTYNNLDSYQKLGSSFAANTSVSGCAYLNGQLYVATASGIAVQKAGSINPAAPESWTDYTGSNGFNATTINQIGTYQNAVLVATNAGLYRFTDSGIDATFLPALNSSAINTFYAHGDSLYIISSTSLYLYYNGNLTLDKSLTFGNITEIVSMADYSYFAAPSGLNKMNAVGNMDYIYPNGPYANHFSSISVDSKSDVWCASGTDVTGAGFYHYNGNTWENVNSATVPGWTFQSVFNTYSGSDGYQYLNTWGSGFIKYKSLTDYHLFNYYNTSFLGVGSPAPNYLVISGTKLDSKENLWVLVYKTVGTTIMGCYTRDSVWYYMPNYADSSLYEYQNLVVDNNDTKWFNTNGDLYFMNENGSLGKPAKYTYGNLSDNASISDKSITCIMVDKRGELWVGTNLGVYALADPSQALNYSAASLTLDQKFPLRQYTINCMAVDALNRKWIGTSQGLLLVSSDGTTVIKSFNSTNSPLTADAVRTIAVDEKTGKIYVGLDAALIEIMTYAQKPADDYSGLFTYPAPYLLSETSSPLTIEGLIKDSGIKIIDISGNLIRSIETLGGYIAQWDGRNEAGQLVSSGVYILVAYDKDGNNVGTKKIAVIRK